MKAGGRTVALVLAAGQGSRAGGGIPKQYRPIGGRPVLAHALDSMIHRAIDTIQVVIGAGQEELYRQAAGDLPFPAPIVGGATRQQSVRNGLAAVAERAERVLIHDSARPFVPAPVIDRLIAALDDHDAAVPVLPVVDTLARGDGGLGDVVDREALFRVQTPQAFRLDRIIAAHDRWSVPDATDDAQIARAAGIEVKMVKGDEALEKLTFEGDFTRAETRLASACSPRTGFGFDVHRFGPGESLWLGGIEIPYQRGLTGHSDADVVLHALTDAILGAIGAGDIGEHFPPSDPRWRGASSSLFVRHALDLVDLAGARIVHVDVTIICEAPRVGPFRARIRDHVAALLRLQTGSVSIKATTTEGLGFTGRGEGIAAQAVATVMMGEAR